MPQYQYKGRNQQGTIIKGLAEAENVEQLKANLRKNGIWVTQAQVKSEAWGKLTSRPEAVKTADLILYTRQVGAMLSAGVSLMRSLETYLETAAPEFKPVIQKLIETIKEGKTYAQALALFPRIFSPFYIGMIQIGETGSQLGEMHQKIVVYLEQGASLKGKILFAALYPCMVLGVTVIGVSIILVFAFPKIAEVYTKNNVQLPWITQMLLSVSHLMVQQWATLLISISAISMVFITFRLHQKQPLKGWLDHLIFKIPVYGKLFRQILLFRFAFNIALLLNSGLPLTGALEVVGKIVDNQVMQGYLEELAIAIKQGEGMGGYLRQNKFFPPLFTSMVRTGEESGQLAKMIHEVSHFYETEVERALTKFIVILEPVLIIFAAVIVIVVLMAFYLPMFQMFQTLHV